MLNFIMKRTAVAITLLAYMVALTISISAQTKHALVLEIATKNGETTTIKEAFLAYYLHGAEDKGIKVRQAGGETLMSWKRIKSIDVTDATNPQDIKAEITLAPDGKKVAVTLSPVMVQGKTDSGDYKVSMDQVRTITPVSGTKK
jgi:hypothetical protein